MSPGSTGTARLRDDRAVVDARADEVHRAAVLADAGGERARMGVEAGKGGSSDGWMLIIRSRQRVDERRPTGGA